MTDRFVVGVDLGQAQDYTAIAVLEVLQHGEEEGYHLRHLERPRLGTSYPDIVQRLLALLATSPLIGCCEMVLDATGVGAPVVDLLRQAGLSLTAVTITGADAATRGEGGGWRVPKRDLVSTLQVALQQGRFKVADGLALGDVFVRELLAFRVKINIATSHDSYEAWREGDHDDLVLAVALALWQARQGKASVISSQRYGGTGEKARDLHFVDEKGDTWTYGPVGKIGGRK